MIDNENFGYRLKLARKKEGHSLRSLSEAIGRAVSAQYLSKYERGEVFPNPSILSRLADALGVSVNYLLSSSRVTLGSIEFRKNSRTLARDRARVEAEVLRAVEAHLELNQILGSNGQWIPPFWHDISQPHDIDKLAPLLRKEWCLGHNPIPDMTELLEEKGVIVLLLALPIKVSGLTCKVERGEQLEVTVIVVNKRHPLERRRFTLAHELGHLLFKVPDDTKATERAANHFAGALLMPESHFRNLLGKHRRAFGAREILVLKRVYKVSGAAFIYRLKQLEFISESQMQYAFRTFARAWRSKEPAEIEPESDRGSLESPKLLELKCYQALAEGLITKEKASGLLGQELDDVSPRIGGNW